MFRYKDVLLMAGLFFAYVFTDIVPPSPAVVSTADIVFRNGTIYTLDTTFNKATAVAIKDGIITFVGTDVDVLGFIDNATRVVDLHGRAATPGLVDAHMHVLEGGSVLLKCDFNYRPLGLEAVLKHVQGCIDEEPAKGDDVWVEAVNLDYQSLIAHSDAVTKQQLDTLRTSRPVLLRSSDAHTALVNSRALALSNITASTPDPTSGKIERLSGNEPSGVLQDEANKLLAGPAPPTEEDSLHAGRAALRLLREAGITTFQDAEANELQHRVFGTLRAENALSARAYCNYRIEAPNSTADIPELVAKTISRLRSMNDNSTLHPKPSLKWQAVKIFLDGVILYPANTGALIEPYWLPRNDTGGKWTPVNSTLVKPYWSPEALTLTLEELFLAGIDAQIHADGDLAVRVGLDAAGAFRKKYPEHDFRLGLAHNELSHPDDWPRFAELGVDAIMSFQWSQPSPAYMPNTFLSLAEYRLNNLEAYAQIEKAGRAVVYGSDWPIDPLDEFLALKVAVTRSGDPKNPNSPASQGASYNGTFPGEGISREAAFRAITINSAKFLRADQYIGSLEVGKLADIIVLERDYFELPEEELGRQRVLLTVVGGEVVYLAGHAGPGFEQVTASLPDKISSLELRTTTGHDRSELTRDGKVKAAKLWERHGLTHSH